MVGGSATAGGPCERFGARLFLFDLARRAGVCPARRPDGPQEQRLPPAGRGEQGLAGGGMRHA
eukprot:1189209-Prorocentrum_minimum.AAC.1